MLARIIGISTTAALVLLIIVIQTTEPSTIGPIGLLAVFFLLYVCALGVVTFLLWSSTVLVSKLSKPFTTKKPVSTMSLQRAYYFSSVIALAPIMMLAMQSVGSLGVYEVVLVIVFLAIGILYVAKRTH